MVQKGPNFKCLGGREIPIVFGEEIKGFKPDVIARVTHIGVRGDRFGLYEYLPDETNKGKVIGHYKSDHTSRRFVLNPLCLISSLPGCKLSLSYLLFHGDPSSSCSMVLKIVAKGDEEKIKEWHVALSDIKASTPIKFF